MNSFNNRSQLRRSRRLCKEPSRQAQGAPLSALRHCYDVNRSRLPESHSCPTDTNSTRSKGACASCLLQCSLYAKLQEGEAEPPTTEQRLAFYELFKQANFGPQPADAARPRGIFNAEGLASTAPHPLVVCCACSARPPCASAPAALPALYFPFAYCTLPWHALHCRPCPALRPLASGRQFKFDAWASLGAISPQAAKAMYSDLLASSFLLLLIPVPFLYHSCTNFPQNTTIFRSLRRPSRRASCASLLLRADRCVLPGCWSSRAAAVPGGSCSAASALAQLAMRAAAAHHLAVPLRPTAPHSVPLQALVVAAGSERELQAGGGGWYARCEHPFVKRVLGTPAGAQCPTRPQAPAPPAGSTVSAVSAVSAVSVGGRFALNAQQTAICVTSTARSDHLPLLLPPFPIKVAPY